MKNDGTFLQLGPLDLVTCDQNDGGCDGGDPASAWTYAQGGLGTEKCIPYLQANGGPVPTCPPNTEPCLDFIDTPACPSTCNDGSAIDRSHGVVGNVYNLGSVQQMMTEMDQNGPIEVAFTVYADFLTYKSGVYQYTTGDALGGHAVKMVGYGTESGTDYWLCQNSWTTTWGDNGFFKIRRGTDECGIEDDAVAGTITA
jgi:cathepsin B